MSRRAAMSQAGIRQFLDIGTGLPSASNTHQVAQEAAPESRVVYVDNDPIVPSHARALPDREHPGAIVARLPDAVPPGSYLAISQIASDVAATEVAEGVQRYNEQAAVPVAARTHAKVCRFFAGLDLVEPGVVQVHRWRAGAGDPGNGHDLAIYAGVGRKP